MNESMEVIENGRKELSFAREDLKVQRIKLLELQKQYKSALDEYKKVCDRVDELGYMLENKRLEDIKGFENYRKYNNLTVSVK